MDFLLPYFPLLSKGELEHHNDICFHTTVLWTLRHKRKVIIQSNNLVLTYTLSCIFLPGIMPQLLDSHKDSLTMATNFKGVCKIMIMLLEYYGKSEFQNRRHEVQKVSANMFLLSPKYYRIYPFYKILLVVTS